MEHGAKSKESGSRGQASRSKEQVGSRKRDDTEQQEQTHGVSRQCHCRHQVITCKHSHGRTT